MKRSAFVNQMYGGWQLVVEKNLPKDVEVMERSDS